jgi:hypothetical protein
MSNALFVHTSFGWINLARVKWVVRHNEKLRFVFSNVVDSDDDGHVHRESLDLDLREGERIMSRLVNHAPECIVGG